MATLSGIRYNPVLKPHYNQLRKRVRRRKWPSRPVCARS
jgi:hypothetical protein